MKKLLSLVLCVVMCLSFTACVSEDKPVKENADGKSKAESFALNETAVFKNLKITAEELQESSGTEFFTPEEGNVFVGIKFTIENISDEEQSISTLLLFDGYADDVKTDYSVNASCVFDEGTLDGDIASGKKMVGWYALEVPQDWSNIELNIQSDLMNDSSAKFVFKK